MSVQDVIKSQYRASFDMIGEAIEQCSDALWDDPAYKLRFWHIAYHALFYTHLYLQGRAQDFVPWDKHRAEYESLSSLPPSARGEPGTGGPYTGQEILEYLELCRNEAEEKVSSLDLDAPSGFHWLPFSKLELQFYNIRHLQLHTGQLIDRLRNVQAVGIGWVGARPEAG
jgi:hypothetical protein